MSNLCNDSRTEVDLTDIRHRDIQSQCHVVLPYAVSRVLSVSTRVCLAQNGSMVDELAGLFCIFCRRVVVVELSFDGGKVGEREESVAMLQCETWCCHVGVPNHEPPLARFHLVLLIKLPDGY